MARQTSQVLRNASFTEVEAFGEWLAKFLLVGENLGLPRFTYNDSSMFILPVYFLVDAAKNNVTEVKINSSSNVLILCEVEIFGECPAGTYTTTDLQCTNCPATCPNSCHRDSGSCSVCKGYSNPPACTAACTNGQWGVNCTKSCSVNCYGQSCDKTTGVCDNGCQGFSDPPNCTTECAQGNWGPNCQFNCGNNCFNLSCDSQTGKCDNGCDGFMDPPDCTVECKVGKWGRNCVDECSSQCRNHSCDRVTGLCLYTCDSLTDLSCPAGLASQTSELTFLSGVGIGIAVGAVVIILIVVGVVAVRRTRITTLRNSSQDDIKPEIRPQTYESVKQINTDEHSYEPSRSSLENGWFGPNKEFKCHCESSCSSDGTCQGNGKCARGWFGLKCQHQDLTMLENTVTTPNVSLLTDRDDRTCMNISGQTIVITFNRTYVFTWLRATLNDSASLPGLTVQFSKTTSMTSKLECLNQKYFLVDKATLDIQCDLTEAIQSVIITGTGQTSLCLLYINGGRNVALKQRTWQTSDYSEPGVGTFYAYKAVDGNTSSNFYGGLSCSSTNTLDPKPMWSVTFPLSEITRYVFYNRDDLVINRLARFVLRGEDSAIQKFSYVDASDTGIPVYIVTDPAKNNLTQVKINTTHYVTLCEVEIYGECIAGTYTTSDHQCTNCPAACSNSCHRDSGSCSVCFGYSNPPACTTACPAGQWGVNCTNTCRVNCYGLSCDKTTGICDKGCQGFSDPPSCTTECGKGTWGPNCQFDCRNNCFNLSCDSQTGKCHNGCDGFMDPPDCIVECKAGKWGRNCVNECSSKCKNQSCDRVTGLCEYICDSLTDLSCPADCPKGYHGSNCTLDCSSTCKDLLCNRLGYCIACVSDYTGRYCEKGSETSGMTFSSGIGIGVAVGALVIILIVVAIVIICRTRLTALRNSSNENIKPGPRLQNYDNMKQINEYNHSYEPSRSTFEEEVQSDKKDERKGNKTIHYENTSNTVYETIG